MEPALAKIQSCHRDLMTIKPIHLSVPISLPAKLSAPHGPWRDSITARSRKVENPVLAPSLELLPVEIITMILYNMPNRSSLKSLAFTSFIMHETYLKVREKVFTRVSFPSSMLFFARSFLTSKNRTDIVYDSCPSPNWRLTALISSPLVLFGR